MSTSECERKWNRGTPSSRLQCSSETPIHRPLSTPHHINHATQHTCVHRSPQQSTKATHHISTRTHHTHTTHTMHAKPVAHTCTHTYTHTHNTRKHTRKQQQTIAVGVFNSLFHGGELQVEVGGRVSCARPAHERVRPGALAHKIERPHVVLGRSALGSASGWPIDPRLTFEIVLRSAGQYAQRAR
jgi:hypothetical protein